MLLHMPHGCKCQSKEHTTQTKHRKTHVFPFLVPDQVLDPRKESPLSLAVHITEEAHAAADVHRLFLRELDASSSLLWGGCSRCFSFGLRDLDDGSRRRSRRGQSCLGGAHGVVVVDSIRTSVDGLGSGNGVGRGVFHLGIVRGCGSSSLSGIVFGSGHGGCGGGSGGYGIWIRIW